MKKSTISIALILLIISMSFLLPIHERSLGEIFNTNVRVNGVNPEELGLPSIALSSNGQVYVVYAEYNFTLNQWGNILFSRSNDGGQSFNLMTKINDDIGDADQWEPSIAVDSAGIIHVIWTDWRNDADGKQMPDGGIDGDNYTDVYYANSSDGGLSFSTNTKIDNYGAVEKWGTTSRRSIAVDNNDKIHVVWTSAENDISTIRYANSTDGGMSFSPSYIISNPLISSIDPSIAIDDNDIVHVAWEIKTDIHHANSTNGGVSFSQPKRITDDSVADKMEPSIDASNGIIGIVWTDLRNMGTTGFDIYFTRSTDGGLNFESNVKLNDDTTPQSQSKPSIAINETGYIAIAWMDKRNSNYDIYFTSSFDGGITFGDGVENNNDYKVNDDIGTEYQYYPEIVMDANGYIYLTWQDYRIGTKWDIYFARSPPELADLEVTSGALAFNPSGSVPWGASVTINATIRNLGDRNASNVVVKFYDGLPGMANQIGVNQTISFIQYLGGVGYAEVLWTAKPGGVHDIYVVVDPDNKVTESNETNNAASAPIFVTEYDYIPINVSPPSPHRIGLGKQVTISAQVKNQGNDAPGIGSTIAFYNESGSPFRTYNVPSLGAGATSGPYSASWTSPLIPGIYNVTVEVDYGDQIAESDEDNNAYTIQFDVREGPITSVVLGAPQYGDSPVYITSSTSVSFSIADSSEEGIVSTHYRLGSSGNWVNYTASGQFGIPSEGEHVLYFNSTDGLGNRESTSQITLRVDNTPPTTSIGVGEPRYRRQADALWNVTGNTPINLSSVDGWPFPVCVDAIEYRIDGTAWSTYTQEFNLSALADGLHTIDYRASDHLGNAEVASNITVNLDNTPPVSSISPNVEKAEAGTTFSISASDSGSGVSYTQYSVDGAGWVTYTAPFTIDASGDHVIRYRSVDNLGNAEAVKILPVTIRGPDVPPDDFLSDYWWILVIIVAVILFLIILFFVWRRRRKKPEEEDGSES